jgi:hypothetical protein
VVARLQNVLHWAVQPPKTAGKFLVPETAVVLYVINEIVNTGISALIDRGWLRRIFGHRREAGEHCIMRSFITCTLHQYC